MSEGDFYTPTNTDVLRMENELLAFEVRFLRTQLGLGEKKSGPLTSPARLSYLEDLERDLVLLVRRMSTSPLGPILRVSGNFRTLEQRYIYSPEQSRDPSLPDRVAHLEQAERDLVSLLKRMGRPPLGQLLRRKREFRTLEQRYL